MTKLFSSLRGDIFGGITAAIVALPLALAFGVYSGMGAEAGLYGAIAAGFLTTLFGGSDTRVNGPTGPITVIAATVIANAVTSMGSLEAGMSLILVTFLLAGACQVGFGLIRVGQYIRYIPYPVISGFMTGIGLILILLQILPFLGAKEPSNVAAVFHSLLPALKAINWSSLLLGLGTVFLVYFTPYLTKLIPSQLIALLVMTAVSYFWQLDVVRIGDIPTGLPAIKWDLFENFSLPTNLESIIIPALTLAALGAIESLITAVVADNMTKTKHDSNKELIGQGLGNMASAMIGGIPGAGATMRTVINIQNGGRTKISGIVHSLALLIILVMLGQYAAIIPLPVLAGLLIPVGINVIDYKGIKHIHHVPYEDTAVMLIVLLMTVFVNLLQAVIVGFVLSAVLFMKKMSEINEEKSASQLLSELADEKAWSDEHKISQMALNQVYIKHLFGPLFFGFTSSFQEKIQEVRAAKLVILRMDRVPYIDQTGVYAIEDALMYLKQQDIEVAITSPQAQPLDMMKRIRIIPELINEALVFDDFKDCMQMVKAKLIQQS